jgi:ribonuclease P protein component
MHQRFFFRKEDRLSQNIIIQKVFQEGSQINHYPFKIFILKFEKPLNGRLQVLITVPKKQFKKAVVRNIIKRRIREAYRLNKYMLTDAGFTPELQIAIAFVYIANEIHDHGFIQLKMIESLKKIKQVIEKNLL